MNLTPSRSSLAIGLRSTLAAVAILSGLTGPATADPTYDSPLGGNGSNEIRGARRVDLSIGRSVIIDLPRDAKEVFVANPAVANAVVRSARKMFLIGISYGGTSVIATDPEGRQISAFEINVGRDLNPLRQTLQRAVPTGRIDVRPAGGSILLTGTVQSAGDAQQAADIAKAFVGDGTVAQSPGSAAAGAVAVGQASTVGQVINALTIAGRDQVMIKVTVVEMARSAIKQLGVNVGGNWNVVKDAAAVIPTAAGVPAIANIVGFGTGILGGMDPATKGLNLSGQVGIGKNGIAGGTLDALERAGVSRVLAEPTLVAISGETATFHAGGEVPVLVTTVCQTGQFCPPSVNYKPYGVALAFTPIVLSPGRISIRVSTEVNEIDRENTFSGGNIGFRTRKTATTVELPSGASMATAGLISTQTTQAITGVPGLINLPVLGALFRSRDFQRRDSELMILVTPYIAKPMESAQVVRPDDGFQDPTDPQALLMGRLNKLYGTSGPGRGRQTPGRFGFITD